MKLKQIRRAKGISTEQLLELAHLDLKQPQYSLIESGKVLPTPKDLQAICEALGVTVGEVFDVVEEYSLDVKTTTTRRTEPSDAEKEELTREAYNILGDRFAMLPQPNPKRNFRMSDAEWAALTAELKRQGYNSVGAYLRRVMLGVGK